MNGAAILKRCAKCSSAISGGHDADDGEHLVVHVECLTQHVGPRSEMLAPVLFGDDHDRRRGGLVGRIDRPPDERFDSDEIEVFACDEIEPEPLSVTSRCAHLHALEAEARKPGDCAG